MNSERFTFFFKQHSPFSNWYLRSFTEDGVVFNCVEQYMMYHKALTFGDDVVANAILSTSRQAEQKRLGRQVSRFDGNVWTEVSKRVVKQGAKLKFSQHSDLLETLLQTKGTTLVEASPYDKIWGIGLEAHDPRSLNRKTWRGENRLGHILTELREEFLSKH